MLEIKIDKKARTKWLLRWVFLEVVAMGYLAWRCVFYESELAEILPAIVIINGVLTTLATADTTIVSSARKTLAKTRSPQPFPGFQVANVLVNLGLIAIFAYGGWLWTAGFATVTAFGEVKLHSCMADMWEAMADGGAERSAPHR